MKRFRHLIASVLALAAANTASAQQAASTATTQAAVSLYTLDCGLTEFADAAYFSDTGEYDGKSLALPTPCYLIRHVEEWLLWDTGNSDKLAALSNGVTKFGGRFTVKRTLACQLAQLGLKPTTFALSRFRTSTRITPVTWAFSGKRPS